jgi:hypothetical protein
MLAVSDQMRRAANNYDRSDKENERLLRECLSDMDALPDWVVNAGAIGDPPDREEEAERRAEEKAELEDAAAEVFEEPSTQDQWEPSSGTDEVKP